MRKLFTALVHRMRVLTQPILINPISFEQWEHCSFEQAFVYPYNSTVFTSISISKILERSQRRNPYQTQV